LGIKEVHLPREIYSVSVLTQKIKFLLEDRFPIIWISGELSNIRIPSSGHAYFTLKDEKAQISAVMFKGQLRQLDFKLEDGITIVGMGRISVYEPRGAYQIILEYIEPHGLGALQLAFEQLKRKLSSEGLFDSAHKRVLPLLPKNIGIITSPSGAVIRDIIHVCNRRFPNLSLEIFPVRVQGESATTEICNAFRIANKHRKHLDLLILARGGGSMEDLAPFNQEAVARAIYESDIPVISAIGHETDFTIADFVADVRAPTPSAAAEIAVPVKAELESRCLEMQQRCLNALKAKIEYYRKQYQSIQIRMLRPYKALQNYLLTVDDNEQRLKAAMTRFIARLKVQCQNEAKQLLTINTKNYLLKNKLRNDINYHSLLKNIKIYISDQKNSLTRAQTAIQALNPLAVLQRGYSITRTLPEKTVVDDPRKTFQGQGLEVLLAKGVIQVVVEKN
jgi:exodeoxyribonuclease VII large subunit